MGNSIKFLLSDENDHDCVHLVKLLEKVEIRESNLLADRVYGA